MCGKCESFGGLWTRTAAGMIRCDCPQGHALAKTDDARKFSRHEEPRISNETAITGAEMLSGTLDFFPGTDQAMARSAIANEIRSMCASDDEVIWLVERMSRLYTKWPGTREMRIVYCSAHRPLDGFEIAGPTQTYPDGIPAERPELPAPAMKALPPGNVSAAESINQTVIALAQAKRPENAHRSISVPDIPILPPGKRISQADIDAAVNKSREEIARKELGL